MLFRSPTEEKLKFFFTDEFSSYKIYDALSNFEERLLIFSSKNEHENKVYRINPLLSEVLEQFFSLEVLLSENSTNLKDSDEENFTFPSSSFSITPMFIAAMYSFVNTYDSVLKTDGSFKKKIESSLQDFFPSITTGSFSQAIPKFLQAAKNLSLFLQDENSLYINTNRWQQFLSLPFFSQAVHIAVASQERFTNSVQNRYASQLYILKKTLQKFNKTENETKVPDTQINDSAQIATEAKTIAHDTQIKITERTISKLAYIIDEKMADSLSTSFSGTPVRLSKILAEENGKTNALNESESKNLPAIFSAIVQNAIFFGIFQLPQDETSKTLKNVRLTIDANFSIVVLDFASLLDLLPVLDLCEFVSFDSVLQLEITKKSCKKAFEKGYTNDEIKEILEKCTIHPLPQNLIFSIDEWFEQYHSCQVYYGFVLHVEERKQKIFEHNAEFSSHIKKVLAPGVYLLDFENAEEFNDCIEKAEKNGLNFINPAPKKIVNPSLAPLKRIDENDELFFDVSNFSSTIDKPSVDSKQHLEKMRQALKSLDATKEQKQNLEERINRKTIIDSQQLKGESVRFEKTEAFGMDYSGKIHILENAIASHALVELCYGSEVFGNAKHKENGTVNFIVLPLAIERNSTETILTAYHEQKEIKLPVGTSISVKRLATKGWDD